MAHNNYHIFPLADDDATCTTTDCTQTENDDGSKRKRDMKTHPTGNKTDDTTKAEKNNRKKNPPKTNTPMRPLSATLQLDRKNKMLYVLLQFRTYENYGLLDTAAIQSAMSANELRRILQAHPAAQLEEYLAPDFKVQITDGIIVPVRKKVLPRFFIVGRLFDETFMILPTMGNILIGMSFFKKYSVTLDLANNIVRFSEFTLQLKPPNGKFKLQMLELRTSQKSTIAPRRQVVIPVVAEKDIGTVTGTVETFSAFERKTELLVSPSKSEIREQQSHVKLTNHLDHAVTIPQNTTIALFKILTPNQAINIQPMTTEQLILISISLTKLTT